MMRAAGRIFYVAPAPATAPAGAVGAAARNKTIAVARALRLAGARAFVVTTSPNPRRIAHDRGVGFVALPASGRGGARRRLTAAITLAGFALRRVGRDDRVLLYNFFPEYLPLAAILRLRGRPATLDVEDAAGPRDALWMRLSYRLLAAVTARRKIVASETLARVLGLSEWLAVPGIAPRNPAVPRFAAPDVRVHMGGSLTRDTGLDLLADGLADLTARAPAAPITTIVTGILPEGAAATIPGATVRSNLDDAAYRALMADVDVGLSLKLAGGAYADTTFPSKVIDIAGSGMLLVSTRIGDVPALFGEDGAIFLDEQTPRALADVLLAIAADRPRAAAIAARGSARIRERLDARAMGARIAAFLA